MSTLTPEIVVAARMLHQRLDDSKCVACGVKIRVGGVGLSLYMDATGSHLGSDYHSHRPPAALSQNELQRLTTDLVGLILVADNS